jgi:hypothetical protein
MAYLTLRTKTKHAADERPISWRRNLHALWVAQISTTALAVRA